MASTSPPDKSESQSMSTKPSPDLLTISQHGPTDLTVRTSDGGEFHVHKKVVCERSLFFNNALNGPFKEAASGVIDMPNDPPTAIIALLQFTYKREYDCHVVEGQPDSEPWRFHLDAYIAGSIYNIVSLKHYAKRRFTSTMFGLGPSGYSVIPKAISILYDSTPDTDRILRDWLEDFSFLQLGKLMTDPEFLVVMATFESFRDAIARATNAERARVERLDDHVADVQWFVKNRVFHGPPERVYYRCPNCRYKMTLNGPSQLKTVYCVGCKQVSNDYCWDWGRYDPYTGESASTTDIETV
ncbi:hypothetical protein BC567DRAFT_288330 [Phyllosticta citribraziliensis]